MEFAAQCIRNAYLLLPRPPTNLANIPTEKEGVQAFLTWAQEQECQVQPSSQVLSGNALLQVISAVLVTGAYISLCLDDPMEVIYYAEQLLYRGSSKSPPSHFRWLGRVAPPAYRYLAKLYLAEARIAMDEILEAKNCLLLPDQFIPDERSHTLRLPYSSLNVTSCLSWVHFLPQTCSQSQDVPLVPSYPKKMNFPLTNLQASGIVLHNLAVCYMLTSEPTESRRLLELSSTKLLVDVNSPSTLSSIREGSEESKSILYPSKNAMGSISSLLSRHQLPKQFLLNWIYLEMKSGRPDLAVQFLRAHIGNEAFGNPVAEVFILRKNMSEEKIVAPIKREIGSVNVIDLESRYQTRRLSVNQLNVSEIFRSLPLLQEAPSQAHVSSGATGMNWSEADWPPL